MGHRNQSNHILLHVILTFLTGGLWLFVLLIKYLVVNSRRA